MKCTTWALVKEHVRIKRPYTYALHYTTSFWEESSYVAQADLASHSYC